MQFLFTVETKSETKQVRKVTEDVVHRNPPAKRARPDGAGKPRSSTLRSNPSMNCWST